jgi:hypothetical protein
VEPQLAVGCSHPLHAWHQLEMPGRQTLQIFSVSLPVTRLRAACCSAALWTTYAEEIAWIQLFGFIALRKAC